MMMQGLKDCKIDIQKLPRAGKRCYHRSELECGVIYGRVGLVCSIRVTITTPPPPYSLAVTCGQ